MRTTRLFVTFLFCLGSGIAAHAKAPRLPAVVAADLKGIAAECTGAGGKALKNDAVKRADLNGDGREDCVLDVGSINCDGADGQDDPVTR
jgi:hypothetical protein